MIIDVCPSWRYCSLLVQFVALGHIHGHLCVTQLPNSVMCFPCMGVMSALGFMPVLLHIAHSSGSSNAKQYCMKSTIIAVRTEPSPQASAQNHISQPSGLFSRKNLHKGSGTAPYQAKIIMLTALTGHAYTVVHISTKLAQYHSRYK